MTNNQSKELSNEGFFEVLDDPPRWKKTIEGYSLLDVWTQSKEHYDRGDYIEVWDNLSIGKTKFRFNKFDRCITWYSSKMTKSQKSTMGRFMANEVIATDWADVNDAFDNAMRKQIGQPDRVFEKIYTQPMDFM